MWVASVSNIDWPSKPGLPSDQQKQELIAILDRVQQLRMNAVILQVRPGADALYPSQLEPWSEYLTGKQGEPPSPYYDPLEFAVTEAHKRGLELHAWFNPYRARHPSAKSEIAATHLSKTRPDIVHRYGRHLWMDPAEPDVQKHSLNVILDVVRRYDVDGIHIDDYFYPYKERDSANQIIPFPDDASYRRYTQHGGRLSRDDFRRAAVDTFIRQIYTSVKQTKPWVKFGISPFGIWRPGYPPQVKGFDAFTELYADARKWVNNGWLDYWTPQLYWAINSPEQSFPLLLEWWVGENKKKRHVWPGQGAHRVNNTERGWQPKEIVDQVHVIRAQRGASGNIIFSMKNLMREQPALGASLLENAYTYFALPPRSTWLDKDAPPSPIVSYDSVRHRITLQRGAGERAMWYAVWLKMNGVWYMETISAEEKEYDVLRQPGVLPDIVAVAAVDRSGNQSGVVTYSVPRAQK